jgi:putative oxidoreductase
LGDARYGCKRVRVPGRGQAQSGVLGGAVGGSTLIALGLFTRQVAFILSGEMAFAYFMSHRQRNFFPLLNGGEPAVLFCFVFLYLVFAGGGPLSLDALL